MGNNKKLKPSKNEVIKRTEVLLEEVAKLNRMFQYIHKLTTEYIHWSGDEDKFKEYLKEIVNATNEENGQFQKSTSGNNSTKKGKQKTKTATTEDDISVQPEDNPEGGAIGV